MVPVGGAIIAARKGHMQLVRLAGQSPLKERPRACAPAAAGTAATGCPQSLPAHSHAAPTPPRSCAQVEAVNGLYPGRASMSPALDLLITLLHWGADGWRAALAAREALYGYAAAALSEWAATHGERLLRTPGNPISLALTLDSLSCGGGGGACDAQRAGDGASQQDRELDTASTSQQDQELDTASTSQQDRELRTASTSQQHRDEPPITFLGSMLFRRCVSGTRVVARGRPKVVAGHAFASYGAHIDDYPCEYLTVAAALGTTKEEVDEFLRRLSDCVAEFRRRRRQQQRGSGDSSRGETA